MLLIQVSHIKINGYPSLGGYAHYFYFFIILNAIKCCYDVAGNDNDLFDLYYEIIIIIYPID